jgi:hypothetical protein
VIGCSPKLEYAMRCSAVCLSMAVLLISVGPGCHETEPVEEPLTPSTQYNEFTTRIEAARLMSDVAKRDEALTILIREASVNGRIEAVKQGLAAISNAGLRDKVAGEAALKLASVSAVEGALAVAKLISKPELRDEVLAKIVKGPAKE